MPYFTIGGVGDYQQPRQLHPEDAAKVIDGGGPHDLHYFDEYEDSYGDHRIRVPVYRTEAEAWGVIIGDIDSHIRHFQSVREELMKRALQSGYKPQE